MATSRPRATSLRLRRSPQTWLALAAIATICFIAFVFISRQVEIARRNRRIGDLTSAHVIALDEQSALREQLASADDLDAIELEARKRLGLVLPGEVKIVFVEEP